nr:MAG TPA: hypothetical protein [Caudoviricetes sp.]
MNMAREYRTTPSNIIGIREEYAAFCLNEACFYIQSKIDEGEQPVFHKKKASFTSMYKDLQKGGVTWQ